MEILSRHETSKAFFLGGRVEMGTGREGVDVKCHILLIRVGQVQKVGSYWSLQCVCGEVQNDNAQHRQHDPDWLAVWHVSDS